MPPLFDANTPVSQYYLMKSELRARKTGDGDYLAMELMQPWISNIYDEEEEEVIGAEEVEIPVDRTVGIHDGKIYCWAYPFDSPTVEWVKETERFVHRTDGRVFEPVSLDYFPDSVQRTSSNKRAVVVYFLDA